MDKETELLSRVTINHLYLAQFEPFRATLLSLRSRNPYLALVILQTIVSNGTRFSNILWSISCPSPSLLTWLSTLELLQFHNCTSSIWSFDAPTLRLRVEFLLFVQLLTSRILEISTDLKKIVKDVSEGFRRDIDMENVDTENVLTEFDQRDDELLKDGGKLGLLSNGLVDSVHVLDKIFELGLKRLKADVTTVDGDGDEGGGKDSVFLEEGELVCLKRVILEHADVFDALCCNIQKQVKGCEPDDGGMAITVLKVGSSQEEEDLKVLGLVQKTVQRAHLDAMKECMEEGDVDGAVLHIRFLNQTLESIKEQGLRYSRKKPYNRARKNVERMEQGKKKPRIEQGEKPSFTLAILHGRRRRKDMWGWSTKKKKKNRCGSFGRVRST